MEKLFVANYKMNGDKNFYKKVNKTFNKLKSEDTVVLCPPFVYMSFFKIKNAAVRLGSQDIANADNKKSTSQISPTMLKEFNVKYSLIGHSERRALGETDEIIAEKVKLAQNCGILPIVCVGEEEHSIGLNAVEKQVKIALSKSSSKEIILAYEPVWAIGTGAQPTVAEIKKAVKLIKVVAKQSGAKATVLYGGSVNASNYKDILMANVDGLLMGGVSLKLDEFIKIVKGE